MKSELKIMAAVTAGLIIAGAVVLIRRELRPVLPDTGQIAVTIEGMVRRPGTYFVPAGTTRFEVLRVAGVEPNSNLSAIDVTEPIDQNDTMTVGKLDKDVTLKASPFSGRACLVNFFVGDIDIVGKVARRKPDKDAPVFEGEKILSGAKGTVELKLVDESLIDLRKESELTVKELYKASESGSMRVHFLLQNGSLWSYLKPQSPNISLVFSTPHMTAEIRGTEIELSTSARGSSLRVIKGMVNAGRAGTGNRVNVSEGQQAWVDSSLEKTIEVRNLTEEDLAVDAETKAIQEEKNRFLSENAVLRQFILIYPDFYLLQEFDPSKSSIKVYRLAPNTDVSEHVEGVNELSKVYLYGGIRLTMSIVERLTRKRVEYYTVLGRENVLDIINRLGGVNMMIDEKSASAMQIKPGLTKVDGKLAVLFLKAGKDDDPALSLRERYIGRQNRLLKAVYENMLADKITFSKILAGQLIRGLETNVNVEYVMNAVNTLKSARNWQIDFLNQAVFNSVQ